MPRLTANHAGTGGDGPAGIAAAPERGSASGAESGTGQPLRRYDIAIHGHGMLPGLVAMHLHHRAPEQALLLLSADREVGGDMLEPVVRSSLSHAALNLVEPFAVARWPGFLVTDGGQPHHHEDEVLLLDPVQLWLELSITLPLPDMVALDGPLRRRGNALFWPGGTAQVTELVDLAQATGRDQCADILGLDAARGLDLPVLADFDTTGEPWDAFQHIPLGDERVYVRKRRFRGNAYKELIGGFGKMLSDLTAC